MQKRNDNILLLIFVHHREVILYKTVPIYNYRYEI